MAMVTEIMDFIDAAVNGAAAGTFGAVADKFGGMITVVATIAFAVFGLAVGLGVVTARAGDLTQLILRIILIFTFGLTWSNFELIYAGLTSTSDSLVTALFSVADTSGADSSVQLAETFANQAQETAAGVIRAESAIARGFLGAIMYLMLAALQAAYILVAGFAKIMIGILIGLAPFAIAATCLNRTQFLFEAWVSSLIGYFMYPVAAAGVMGFIVSVATRAFDTSAPETLIGITGVVVIIIVGIYALWTIPQIASNVTGQLNLGGIAPQALSIVGRPATKAGAIGTGMGRQILSGATTGGETAQRSAQVRRFGSAMDMKLANVGARMSGNAPGRFVQRRRDVQFARESNERHRAKAKQ